jgi:hypothetical protein
MKVSLTPEIRAVLDRSTITATSLALPASPRLEPKLYKAVNAALEAAGGKWNKSAKVHLFPSDPRPLLGMALVAGSIVNKVKAAKKERQAFYTPMAVADIVAELADVRGKYVLEPQAGGGALADACMKCGAKNVYCIEIDPIEADRLRTKTFYTLTADFLSIETETLYDRVVMNPPFTKGADIKHVNHARRFLKPHGRLIAILPDKEYTKIGPYKVLKRLPAGAFRESGTMIATQVIQIIKP